MRQRKFSELRRNITYNIDSYVRCLTQSNCKGLIKGYVNMLTKTFLITLDETNVSENYKCK